MSELALETTDYAKQLEELEQEAGPIDREEAEWMLALLGVTKTDPVILCAGDGYKVRYPQRVGEAFDWEAITAAAAGGRDWRAVEGSFGNHLNRGLGFISCPGGARVKEAAGLPSEIFEVPALVYEIDSIPKSEQIGLWEKAGLPEPTLVMDTGGKSLHVWYRLEEPVSVEQGRQARRRLSAAIDAVLPEGKFTDKAMCSPHQPARLAGGTHPKTGERSKVIRSGGAAYGIDELMAVCPEIEEKITGQGYGDIWPDHYEEDELKEGESLPTLPMAMPVPLMLALSKKTRQLIIDGQDAGGNENGQGRAVTAYRLSRTLQAAEEQLRELGQTEIKGTARELFVKFVINSELYGGDADEAYAKHWETDDIGCGELSKVALLRVLAKFQLDNRGQRQWGKKRQPDCWKEQPEEFWMVRASVTPELIVQHALELKATEEGRPLTSFQGRFLRYEPEQGYFQQIPANTLKREIATELLPRLYSWNARTETAFRKHTTDTRATNCVKWLNTVLHEDRMDVVPAIAFSNGTYRLDDGQLIEHSPDHRLTFSIQGDFQPCSDCPPAFRSFVVSSFGEEWLPIIQMTLRYLVDPTFKPSKIVMILGPSGSGKGTLERLIESMFPSSCISVITSGFSEINNPDKIHQFVRGKRLVTFPDLQGRQVGVGTLYSMTDGGLLTSRKLHESDADEGEAFKGRVVICSTQPPSMEDAGNGMTRRMLVLKTKDRQGQAPDNDLDDKLRPELGAIVSWALQADRGDVKAMLSSGDAGGILRESGLAAEVQMDPIRSFIDQCLTPADGGEIANDALLFAAFKLFCHDQQHKCAAQRTFVNRLKAALPHLRMERQTIPGTGATKKTKAVFFGLKLMPGLIAKTTDWNGRADIVSMRDVNQSLNRDCYGEGQLQAIKRHRPQVPTVEALLKAQPRNSG